MAIKCQTYPGEDHEGSNDVGILGVLRSVPLKLKMNTICTKVKVTYGAAGLMSTSLPWEFGILDLWDTDFLLFS